MQTNDTQCDNNEQNTKLDVAFSSKLPSTTFHSSILIKGIHIAPMCTTVTHFICCILPLLIMFFFHFPAIVFFLHCIFSFCPSSLFLSLSFPLFLSLSLSQSPLVSLTFFHCSDCKCTTSSLLFFSSLDII